MADIDYTDDAAVEINRLVAQLEAYLEVRIIGLITETGALISRTYADQELLDLVARDIVEKAARPRRRKRTP